MNTEVASIYFRIIDRLSQEKNVLHVHKFFHFSSFFSFRMRFWTADYSLNCNISFTFFVVFPKNASKLLEYIWKTAVSTCSINVSNVQFKITHSETKNQDQQNEFFFLVVLFLVQCNGNFAAQCQCDRFNIEIYQFIPKLIIK